MAESVHGVQSKVRRLGESKKKKKSRTPDHLSLKCLECVRGTVMFRVCEGHNDISLWE